MIAILGPTGAGKSELAVLLAERIGGEIVNYDSVQIYRGFDLGTAKPSVELRARAPHHLLDIVEPDEEFHAAEFAARAMEVCAQIRQQGAVPILAGGTGFYLRALLTGLPEMPPRNELLRARLQAVAAKRGGLDRLYRWLRRIDPEAAERIAPGDRHRIERALEVWIQTGRPISSWPSPAATASERLPSIKIGLRVPRELLVQRLEGRTEEIYRRGLVEETRALLARYPESARPFSSIGYREAVLHLRGELTLDQAIAETSRRTRAYARRQMTWLRRELNVHWVDAADPASGALDAMLRIVAHETG
ncbi:MAG TPA: tRNA (adenosine(37)-N6)-dimethylallyltransferase MiaA [Thermoanaerobaculia bacterium]|nr:tRNA (adenosine(37)-N6)-dimethylallyltransferase MiaA [Thermoanaerobaculia bacterium]